MRPLDKRIFSTFLALYLSSFSLAQGGHPRPVAPPAGAKSRICKGRQVPQLEDVTQKAGIQFRHVGAPEKKYIVESMSGGSFSSTMTATAGWIFTSPTLRHSRWR
jgi:hypothetical protein